MAISPWRVNQTLPLGKPTLTYDNGTVVDLTGYTGVTLRFVNLADGTSFTGAGSVAVPTPASGQIEYTWAASDVAQEGRYVIQPIVQFSSGELRCDDIPWVVLP